MEGLQEVHFSSANFAVKKAKRVKKEKILPKKIALWLKNLESFYLYNPEYQEGIVQFGVPALQTESYSYLLAPGEIIEDVLISLKPERCFNWIKASLKERRSGMGKGHMRVIFSQTYYVEEGGAKATLLLENDDWLKAEKVDNAFGFILKKEKGQVLENLDWRTIQYKGYQNIARILKFQDKEGAVRFLICTASSGTILNLAEDDIEIGEICPVDRSFGSPVLRYQRTSTGLMRLQNL